MKKETKELIEFIKQAIAFYYFSFTVKSEKEFSNLKKIKDNSLLFLDSLENIENQLKNGGFIPDMHKTPCKAGDIILIKALDCNYAQMRYKVPEVGEKWKLIWNPKYFRFEIKCIDETIPEEKKDTYNLLYINFEKVE